MRVEIGPVPIDSAEAWLGYAADVIAELRTRPRSVSPEVLDAFSRYVAEWTSTAGAEAARHDPVFRWSGDAMPETVEYLVFALYKLGVQLTAEEDSGERPPRPAAADRFHTVLVRSVLGALECQGEAEAQFVNQLREVWQPANERT
jgi:hypothetical protein